MASEPARARLLWTILSLVLPVTFGYTIACRSPALAFSTAIHFALKRSAPCSAVLRNFPKSWAAVVHQPVLMSKALRSSRKHPIHSFSLPPMQPASLTNSLDIAHFGNLVSSMRARSASCAKSRRDALMCYLDKRVQIKIGWSGRFFFRQPMQRVRKLWRVQRSMMS